MILGTFATVRLRNRLVEREGGFTGDFPGMARRRRSTRPRPAYASEGVPLVVLAGKEYGVVGILARLGGQGNRAAGGLWW